MVQLQNDLEAIDATGTQVVGVSYDSVDVLQKFADKNKLGYLLLADEESKAIDAYGIRNTTAPAGSRTDGIPHPATYLVDEKGIVRAILKEEGYAKRHPNAELIETAKKIE